MSQSKYKEAYNEGFKRGKKMAFDGFVYQGFDELSKKEQIEILLKDYGADLPEMTNGDVIKVVFPNCYCKHGQDINDLKGDFATIVLAGCGGYIACQVDWWNAKYKGGKNEP